MKEFTRSSNTTIQEVGGRFKSEVVIKRYETEDGIEHEFTTFNRENSRSVAVVALTGVNKAIVSRQFRAGRELHCDDLPGGSVDANEDTETAARRELLEETGYEPGCMEYLGQFSWIGNSNMTSHYYLATDCEKVGEPQLDQVEIDQGLEVRLVPISELIEIAKTDRMCDAVAVLLAYEKLKELEGGHEEGN